MKNLLTILFLFCSPFVQAQTFTLTAPARTSAGVFKTDSTLLRTLWANVNYGAGTFAVSWDGKDDYGNTIPSPGSTFIKVLSNNVTYSWLGIIGNTSAVNTGTGVHRGYYTSMTGMAITGTTAYFCQGYSERYSSQAKFDINNPQVRLDLGGYGGNVSTMNADFVATDGIYVYWAGYDRYVPGISFVQATRVSNDAQVLFSNGVAYTMQHNGPGKTYTSTIDKLNSGNSNPTGLAVQQTDTFLFVAHGGINQLHVLGKAGGGIIRNLTYTNPRYLSIEGSSLWMVTGTNTISKYTVATNGTLSAPTLTISGVSNPGAIQCNGSGTIAVIDQANQVVRFFNTTTGAEATQLGTNGGYASSPDVTNTKYFFNDFRGNTFSFLCYAPDGSFWLGDPGNYRELHFTSGKTFIETIMSMGASYSTCVDPNNITRVFGNYLEFAVDYTQPLTGSTGWTLVKNWGYGRDQINNPNSTKRLLNVVSFGGHTYGYDYRTGAGLVELTASGLRITSVDIGNNTNHGIINSDGSLTRFSGQYNLGSSVIYKRYALLGFDGSNNPIWSNTGTLLAATPPNTLQDPDNFPGNVSPVSYNNVTASGKVIFYNPSKYYAGNTSIIYDGYHLGAIRIGGSAWLWKTQRANAITYGGSFPGAEFFEMGNHGNQNAGSNVNVLDNNIITGYPGEFWRNGQTNYYNHYNEDGLPIGQFGTDFYVLSGNTNIYPLPAPGMDGNAKNPCLVKDGSGNLYLIHGGESYHGGIHVWKISNVASIRVQYIGTLGPVIPVTPPVHTGGHILISNGKKYWK